MIDNSLLMNYGILGLWTVNLLYEKYVQHTQQKQLLIELKDVLIKIETKLNC